MTAARTRFMSDIDAERERQLGKWGEQHHTQARWLAILGEEFGEVAKNAVEMEFGDSYDEDKHAPLLREELVQLAAVAVAWLEDLEGLR